MIKYAKGFHPPEYQSCSNHYSFGLKPELPHFVGKSGLAYDYDGVARAVRCFSATPGNKNLIKASISIQLEAIGILEDFEKGITPFQLPATFHYGGISINF